MAEDEKQQRPVRKLTVKNFSVIKDAELEFGKITVLIGPQSSGKSLLCKLAYFLEFEVAGTAGEAAASNRSWDEFEALVGVRFRGWFPPEAWGTQGFLIRFESDRYLVEFSGPSPETGGQVFGVRVSDEFRHLYWNISQSMMAQVGADLELAQSAAWSEVRDLQDPTSVTSTYFVPAGRAFFTSADLGFALMQNPGLEVLTRRFAPQIIWNSNRWMPGLLASEREAPRLFRKTMDQIVGGEVIDRGNLPVFRTPDDRLLPLPLLSSGTQELLPLFNFLTRLVFTHEHAEMIRRSRPNGKSLDRNLPIRPRIYLEEPEAHIFPTTQFELVKLFASLANDPILSFGWVITTHSPYILSSFNNLVEAGQAARDNPKLHDEVAKIVPEQYWIKEGDFKAYAIEDGVLKSIVNESGFVEGNYLDQVSESIGDEFDKLVRLEYEHTKAS